MELTYVISGSAGLAGLVTFAAMILRVLVTPISGYLSDRYDRRKVLACMFGLNFAHNSGVYVPEPDAARPGVANPVALRFDDVV
jgi:MFS family permease